MTCPPACARPRARPRRDDFAVDLDPDLPTLILGDGHEGLQDRGGPGLSCAW